jgi:hypothetical protein
MLGPAQWWVLGRVAHGLRAADALILRVSLARPRAVLVVALLTGAAAGTLSLQRRRHAHLTPLMFDDELPSDVSPLRLKAD